VTTSPRWPRFARSPASSSGAREPAKRVAAITASAPACATDFSVACAPSRTIGLGGGS
jgi:hypothetical protein